MGTHTKRKKVEETENSKDSENAESESEIIYLSVICITSTMSMMKKTNLMLQFVQYTVPRRFIWYTCSSNFPYQ